jgi:ribose-phosphate pyrophosphokinase
MIVFSNQKSEALAQEVAAGVGVQLGKIEKKVFPDGEIYIRLLTPVKGEEVALIYTTQSNDDLVELLLTLSALKDNRSKKILLFMPHMIYQRQDTAFKEGEAISAKTVLELVNNYADRIITFNAHFLDKCGKRDFMGITVMNLDAFPLLGKYFEDTENLVIVSPDEGSKDYARSAAEAVGSEYDYLIKNRIDGETVEMQPKDLEVTGKNIVILDDIISTGGTMKKAAEHLMGRGARSVAMGCVHGIFAKGTDIFGDFEVLCTDSLPGELSKVSLAPIITDYLKSLA